MTQDVSRANLVRRIKAILSKTIENGATEAEAMSALAKAQAMMREHGLDNAAIQLEEFVQAKCEKAAARRMNFHFQLAHGVGMFTGCFAWRRGEDKLIEFAGRQSDVLFATWLIDALDGFANRQALSYVGSVGGAKVEVGKRQIQAPGQNSLFGFGELPAKYSRESDGVRDSRMRDFAEGVVVRVGQRLEEMSDADARRRRDLAKAELERQGRAFVRARANHSGATNSEHFAAGVAAGEGARFHRPMGGSSSSAPLAIGRA